MPIAIQTSRLSARASSLSSVIPGVIWLIHSDDAVVANVQSGTGGSFSKPGSNVTFTPTTGSFTAATDTDQYITISNASAPGNNGTFIVRTIPTANSLLWQNSGGANTGSDPGCTWVLHGRASSITDRVAAHVFSQATDGERPALNTVDIPGHRVLSLSGDGNTAARRTLRLTNSALAGQLNGSAAFTIGLYWRPRSGTALNNDIVAHTDDSTTYNQCVGLGTRAVSGLRFRQRTPSTTNYDYTTNPASNWMMHCLTYDSAGQALYYENETLVATPTAGPRGATGFDEVVIGENAVSNSQRTIFVGGIFVALGLLSTANQASARTYFENRFL